MKSQSVLKEKTNNWIEVKLGALVDVQGGFAFKSSDFKLDGIPVIKIRNVRQRVIDASDADCVSIEIAQKASSFYLKNGDIIISMTESGPQAPDSVVGRVARYSGPNDKFLINQRVGRINIRDSNKLDKRYLFFVLTSPRYQNELVSISTGSANQANISGNQIRALKIPLLLIEQQKAIADVLGVFDDKIELNRKMNETLEQMAQAIFKSWFVDFDPVKAKAQGKKPFGMDDETAALFPDSFEDSPLGKIPKEWKELSVEELCGWIENGGTPSRNKKEYWSNGTIPWFKTGELKDGPLINSEESISKTGLENSSCKLWNKGTILIALYASPTVGKLGILEVEGTSNQACSALIARPEIGKLFLYYSLLFSSDRLQNIAVGSAQQNISQAIVKSHKVVAPNNNLPVVFNKIVQPLHDLKVSNINENNILSKTRDELLPKLLSGKIQVGEWDGNI